MTFWSLLFFGLAMTVTLFVSLASPVYAQDATLFSKTYSFSQQEDSGGWYPYQIPNDAQRPGILLELTPMIFARAGLKLEMQYLPEKRSVTGYQQGWIDFEWVSPAWFPDGQLPETDLQTRPILNAMEVIYSRYDTPAIWKTADSLKGQQVGTITGYSYATDEQFLRHDVANESALVRMLNAGRLDVAISDKLSAQYWARELKMPIRVQATYSDGPLVIRTKKAINPDTIPLLNKAIASLIADGTVNRVVETYIGKTE